MKIKAALVALLTAATIVTVTPTPAGAGPTHRREVYTNCAGSGWDNWYYFTGPSWGLGNWCGEPADGYWRVAAQDASSDGGCVSAFANPSLTDNTLFKEVAGTRVCGYGYMSRTGILTFNAKRVRIVRTVNGHWSLSYEIYNAR